MARVSRRPFLHSSTMVAKKKRFSWLGDVVGVAVARGGWPGVANYTLV